MTSLRNHRVVIASLFLPTTAVLGESTPATPEIQVAQPEFIPKFPSSSEKKPARTLPTHTRQTSASLIPPIRSIVEDLKDKVRTLIWLLAHMVTYRL